MSNNEETEPSDQDADEMDYEGEQEYLDYLTAKQGLQVGLDDGTELTSTPTVPAPMTAPRPMAAPRPAGKIPAGKVPAPMPLPKRRSRRSRAYENLTN